MTPPNVGFGRLVRSLGLCFVAASAIEAQAPSAPPPIRDNSFLIEEAYNQEWGVVQHVGTFQKVRGGTGWGATFTQEWPAPSERHQLSYTIPLMRSDGGAGLETGVGDIALNYRYQVPVRAGSTLAMAPRFSLVTPVGDEAKGRGAGAVGLELNLPTSIELSRMLVTHFNVGGSWTPSARNVVGEEATTSGVFAGASLIFLVHPKVNLMVETLWSQDASVVGPDRTESERAFVIAPGIRGAIDFPSGLQIVPGVAFPIGIGPSEGEKGIYLYLSFEHPFRRR